MKVEKLDNIEIYQKAVKLTRIFSEAVEEAREENKRMGLPNVFSIDGHIYYEMPDGKIIREIENE